jgi:ATP-dependent DNA ligase
MSEVEKPGLPAERGFSLSPARATAFEPCLPTRGTKVPAGADWIHEIKYDGYRLIVQRDGKHVRLFTRNGGDDLRKLPLSLRKTNLARLLARRPDGIFVHRSKRARSAPTCFARHAHSDWKG